MKNILFILVIVLAGAFIYLARPEPLPTDSLVVFSQQQCGHCHDALAFIEAEIKPAHPDLTVDVRDVADHKHMKQLMALVRERNLNTDNLGTPVLVLGDMVLVGWTEANEAALMQAVSKNQPHSQAMENTGLCQVGDTEHCAE